MKPKQEHRLGRWLVLAHLGWRNIWRNRIRSGLTLAAMGVGLMVMVFTAALNEGMLRKFLSFATEVNMGHMQAHHALYIKDRDLYATLPLALMEQLERETGLPMAPRAYAAALASAGDRSNGVLLKAVHPTRERAVTRLSDHLREGSFRLDTAPPQRMPDGSELPVHHILIGNRLAHSLDVGLGGEVVLITSAADGSIGNGLFRVAGIFNPLEPAFDRMGVVLSLSAYQGLMYLEGGVHEFAITTPDIKAAPAHQQTVRAALAGYAGPAVEGGVANVRVRRWDEMNKALADIIELSQISMLIVMGIIFSVAGLGMMNTVMMAIHERRREFGMLLAMGMGRGRLMGMVLLESLFLVLLGGAMGAVGGVGLSLWVGSVGLDFSRWMPNGIEWSGVTIVPHYYPYLAVEHVTTALWLMCGIVMASALWPAWRTVRIRPAEGMRK